MVRLLALVCAIVGVDTVFFSALTPLLPHYAAAAGLSKAGAGILIAAYPAGTLIGSLPSGALVARFGDRTVAVLGLALMGVSTLAFGWSTSAGLLDAARFVQGIGGACTWTAALSWLATAAPESRRGRTARHRARRRGGRRAVRAGRRGRGQRRGPRGRVLRRLGRRRVPHRRRVHRAVAAPAGAAAAAGGAARAARPAGRDGLLADGARRDRLRHARRARAAAAVQARRVRHGDRRHVPVRGAGRVRAVTARGAAVRPGRRGPPARGLARRRRRVRRRDTAADLGPVADRRPHRGNAVLRHAVRPRLRARRRGRGTARPQPGHRLRRVQPDLGGRAVHRRVWQRCPGPGHLRPGAVHACSRSPASARSSRLAGCAAPGPGGGLAGDRRSPHQPDQRGTASSAADRAGD